MQFSWLYQTRNLTLEHHCARTAATLCLQSIWLPSGVSKTPQGVKNSTHSAESLNASSSTTNATDNFIGLYLCNAETTQNPHVTRKVTHRQSSTANIKCHRVIITYSNYMINYLKQISRSESYIPQQFHILQYNLHKQNFCNIILYSIWNTGRFVLRELKCVWMVNNMYTICCVSVQIAQYSIQCTLQYCVRGKYC